MSFNENPFQYVLPEEVIDHKENLKLTLELTVKELWPHTNDLDMKSIFNKIDEIFKQDGGKRRKRGFNKKRLTRRKRR